MNIRLTQIAAALAASSALTLAHAADSVRVCTMPGSPSSALDQSVAREVLHAANLSATFVKHGIEDGNDDDGLSAHELVKSLGHGCDVIVGLPRSPVADASDSHLVFSRSYLRSGYVSITLHDAPPTAAADGKETIAATWSSPSQLIAVQQKNARFDLENTSGLTVDAVAKHRAQRAIVWYPAVVAYQRAHPQSRFDVSPAQSPYADWNLVFAASAGREDLQARIDRALTDMDDDGRLGSLTRDWALPESAAHAAVKRVPGGYRDAAYAGRPHASAMQWGGGFIKVSASSGATAPSFSDAQVAHGKELYTSACAKCHGVQLEGITAPALSGPAFAPASNSHLTIGGIYQYMSTNMPADRPGKLSDEDYADLMAFLLYTNGYETGDTKLTADVAGTSTTPLNAGPRR